MKSKYRFEVKSILTSFFPAFILIFLIAAIRGAVKPVSSESPIIFRNIKEDYGMLVYECGDKQIWRWSIDKDSLYRHGSSIRDFSPVLSDYDPFALKNLSDVLIAFAGGASAGYNRKSISTFFKSKISWTKKLKRITGGILGAISGWTLGDWVGSYWLQNCESESVRKFTAESDNWYDIEKTVGSLRLSRALTKYDNEKKRVDRYLNTIDDRLLRLEKEKQVTLRKLDTVQLNDQPLPVDKDSLSDEILLVEKDGASPSEFHSLKLNQVKSIKKIIDGRSPEEFVNQIVAKDYNYSSDDFKYISILYYICTYIDDLENNIIDGKVYFFN